MGTIIVAAILFGALGYTVFTLIRNKKKGKTSCGCDCASCGMQCHR